MYYHILLKSPLQRIVEQFVDHKWGEQKKKKSKDIIILGEALLCAIL